MTAPRMEPSFWNAFRDPRFLVTLMAILGTAFVAYYRLGQLEKNQDEWQQSSKDRQEKYEERFRAIENTLKVPRYTLEDDEKRMAAAAAINQRERDIDQREMDRRAEWMDEQNKFRFQMIEFATESRAAIKELRGLITELKQ